MSDEQQAAHARVDKLLDAIELVKADRKADARRLLQEIIHEDSNFEAAWLWLSVAVDSVDQSSICLDNVLRVNPSNQYAALALYRIREPEIRMIRQRNRMLFYRDMTFIALWVLVFMLFFIITSTVMNMGAPPPMG
jgi:hypothetical protein